MDYEQDIGHFDTTDLSMGGGFADLALASHSGFEPADFEDEDAMDDEFGRWLEVQSLRFRGKQLAD